MREARHILILWVVSKKATVFLFITSLVWRVPGSNPQPFDYLQTTPLSMLLLKIQQLLPPNSTRIFILSTHEQNIGLSRSTPLKLNHSSSRGNLISLYILLFSWTQCANKRSSHTNTLVFFSNCWNKKVNTCFYVKRTIVSNNTLHVY